MSNPSDISRYWLWENRLKLGFILPVAHLIALVFAVPTFSPAAFAVFAVTLFLGQIGYTMGYHRMLAHGSFQTHPIIRYGLILLGIFAAQDGPLSWAAVHRKHHQYADGAEDPHSPGNSFFHGYIGWAWGNEGLLRSQKFYKKWIPDLLEDPVLRFFDRCDLVILSASAVALYVIGGLPFLVWGFFLRLVVGLHIFWILNTMSHLVGSRPWKTKDNSRNNWVLGILVQGEGWHNNHHYLPRSARHGFQWWQVDLTWYLICILEKFGQAWNVVRPLHAQQQFILKK